MDSMRREGLKLNDLLNLMVMGMECSSDTYVNVNYWLQNMVYYYVGHDFIKVVSKDRFVLWITRENDNCVSLKVDWGEA